MYIQVLVLVTTWLAYPSYNRVQFPPLHGQQGIVLNFHLLNSHDEWMVQVIVNHSSARGSWFTLPWTNSSPLKLGRDPKRKESRLVSLSHQLTQVPNVQFLGCRASRDWNPACKLTSYCFPHAGQCSTTCRSHWLTSWRLLRKPRLRHMAAKKSAWKEAKTKAVSKHSDHYTPPNLTFGTWEWLFSKRNLLFQGLVFRFYVKFQGSRWYLVFSNWLNK